LSDTLKLIWSWHKIASRLVWKKTLPPEQLLLYTSSDQYPDIFLFFNFFQHSCCKNYTLDQVFFKENVRSPVWICRDPISLILGTRSSLIFRDPMIIFYDSRDTIWNSRDLNLVPKTPNPALDLNCYNVLESVGFFHWNILTQERFRDKYCWGKVCIQGQVLQRKSVYENEWMEITFLM